MLGQECNPNTTMHARCVAYQPDFECYRHHYQRGGGTYSVFRGAPNQAGHGIGSALSGFFKGLLPMLKRTGATAVKSLVKTGTDVLADVIEGKNVTSSLKQRGVSGVKRVGQHVEDEISQKFLGPQTGGKRRSRRLSRVVGFSDEEPAGGKRRKRRKTPLRTQRRRPGANWSDQRGGFFALD